MAKLPSHERAELLTRAREGEADALGALLALYRDYLRLLARVHVDRRLQAKVDPSDLVQETCLQIHRDFPAFRGVSEVEFLQWVRQIMATRGGKMVRRWYGTRQRDVRLERRLEADLEEVTLAIGCTIGDDEASPASRAEQEERAVAVAAALDELPDNYREVIILYQVEGATLREVAARMGRSEDSVQKLWARAVVRLRKALKRHE